MDESTLLQEKLVICFFFVLYIDQALGENSAFKRSLQLMVKYALWRP